jgi:hypothetical protein
MAPQTERKGTERSLEESTRSGVLDDKGHCRCHAPLSPQKPRTSELGEQSFVIRGADEEGLEVRPESDQVEAQLHSVPSRPVPQVHAGESSQRLVTEEVTAVTKLARARVGRVALRVLVWVENHRATVFAVALGVLFFAAAVALVSWRS